MAYSYRKLRVEPHRGVWFRWKATPIALDEPDTGAAYEGMGMELDGLYVLCHPFKFMGRSRETAVRRATRWMERANERAARHDALTKTVTPTTDWR